MRLRDRARLLFGGQIYDCLIILAIFVGAVVLPTRCIKKAESGLRSDIVGYDVGLHRLLTKLSYVQARPRKNIPVSDPSPKEPAFSGQVHLFRGLTDHAPKVVRKLFSEQASFRILEVPNVSTGPRSHGGGLSPDLRAFELLIGRLVGYVVGSEGLRYDVCRGSSRVYTRHPESPNRRVGPVSIVRRVPILIDIPRTS